jgi:ribonuclease P protein component
VTSSAGSDEAARSGDAGGRRGFRWPRAARLRQTRDIRRVQRTGRRYRGSLIDVLAAPSPAGRARVAVIVPRYGRSAVKRNLLRRRLTDLARTEWMPRVYSEHRQDFILRAKPAAYAASYEGLRDALTELSETVCGS